VSRWWNPSNCRTQGPWHHHQCIALLWNRLRLSYCSQEKASGLLMRGVILLYNSACSSLVHTVQNMLCSVHWNVLDETLYRSNLSACDCHAFAYLRKVLKGHNGLHSFAQNSPQTDFIWKALIDSVWKHICITKGSWTQTKECSVPIFSYIVFLFSCICSIYKKVLWLWKILISKFWQITYFEPPPPNYEKLVSGMPSVCLSVCLCGWMCANAWMAGQILFIFNI
jgi:hypothetical protein